MVVKGLRASKQLLEGAKQISTHGNTKEFQKSGGVHEAFQDFMSLKLSSARNFRSWDGVIKIIEPRCEKTGLRGFRPGPDTNRAVQPQKMARGLKFRI